MNGLVRETLREEILLGADDEDARATERARAVVDEVRRTTTRDEREARERDACARSRRSAASDERARDAMRQSETTRARRDGNRRAARREGRTTSGGDWRWRQREELREMMSSDEGRRAMEACVRKQNALDVMPTSARTGCADRDSTRGVGRRR